MVAKIFYRSWIQLLFISFFSLSMIKQKFLSAPRGVNWPRFLTPRTIRGGQKNPRNAINSTRAETASSFRSIFQKNFDNWMADFSSENEPARAWGTNLNSKGCMKSNFDGFKKWVGWYDFKFFFSEIKSKSNGPRRSLRGFQTLAKKVFRR